MNKLTSGKSRTISFSNFMVALVAAIALVLVAFVSTTKLAQRFSSPEAYTHQIEVLDAKKQTAVELALAAGAASNAISLIPDDACTPIANQLAQISKDITIVLGFILTEKYLLTLLGSVFFGVIVPLCCVVSAIALLMPKTLQLKGTLLSAATRVFLAGAIIWGSVPAGVFATDHVENTYHASIARSIDAAKQSADLSNQPTDAVETDKTLVDRIGDVIMNPVASIDSVANAATNLADKTRTVLSSCAEGVAVVFVTTCVIPVVVVLAAARIAEMILMPVLGGTLRMLPSVKDIFHKVPKEIAR